MNQANFGLFDSEDKPDKDEVYSVAQLNKEARYLLEESFGSIWVEGEVSNLHVSSAGHQYFTLKEENSEIDAVMFSGDKSKAEVSPEDGMALLARGTLTVYEKRGRYQLRVRDLKEIGEGELQKKFQKLKNELKKEGLFEESHKKKVPGFPDAIGIITSPAGAAIRDISSTIAERFPPVKGYVFPVKVQGEEAAGEISSAIKKANDIGDELGLDALIVSRGGGSLEDLWPFNEESVARAIYDSRLPVVSGVGHEVDFTISDFVADRRVPTPTAAGKEIVPDGVEVENRIELMTDKIVNTVISSYREKERDLGRLKESFGLRIPFRKYEDRSQEFDELSQELIEAAGEVFTERTDLIESLVDRLSLANPTSLLKKGYSVTYGEEGKAVTSYTDVEEGENLKTRLFKGIIRSVVTGADENE